jgi:DNA topoisomerase-1
MTKSNARKSLVIVESPAKAKTINRYLGPSFEVKASMGHIRDLPSKGLNVDIENNFEPTYDIMPGKKRVVTALKAAAKGCDTLFLATDLDREGEAIAWHLGEILGFPKERTYRVIFNAITKSAIQEAFAAPGRIASDKVMAQRPAASSIVLWATRSVRCSGRRSPEGFQPAASSPLPSR